MYIINKALRAGAEESTTVTKIDLTTLTTSAFHTTNPDIVGIYADTGIITFNRRGASQKAEDCFEEVLKGIANAILSTQAKIQGSESREGTLALTVTNFPGKVFDKEGTYGYLLRDKFLKELAASLKAEMKKNNFDPSLKFLDEIKPKVPGEQIVIMVGSKGNESSPGNLETMVVYIRDLSAKKRGLKIFSF